MPRPDSTPVSVTPAAIKQIIAHAQHARGFDGSEACGLVFGHDSVGSHVVAVRNVHPESTKHFLMDAEGVVISMEAADAAGEELVAVYHSHPTSAPIPSVGDRSTPHIGPGSPVYVIVGLEDPAHPLLTAWRMDLPFVGEPRATQVQVHASTDGQPHIANPPMTPWSLTPGNKVALTYQRPGHANQRTIVCEITAATPGSGLGDGPGKVKLDLRSARGTDPKSILVERVKAVRVLRESPQAGRVRQRVAAYGRSLADVAERGGFDDVAKYSAFVVAAFPAWLSNVEGE